MLAAKIFRPLRRRSRSQGAGNPPEDRVGKQPVTNTSPPGALLSTLPALPDLPKLPAVSLPNAREEGWLALLEMVFEVTGWPDAD